MPFYFLPFYFLPFYFLPFLPFYFLPFLPFLDGAGLLPPAPAPLLLLLLPAPASGAGLLASALGRPLTRPAHLGTISASLNSSVRPVQEEWGGAGLRGFGWVWVGLGGFGWVGLNRLRFE